ncbi:PilN domain-containing protein [Candidatus Curtissbacteria bacterium]|nr:PilN domain-containing protein [Candidatus Curtissbacteria bacterium]
MSDINLIPSEERASARVELLQKRLQIFSIGFLVTTAVLTILTLSLFAMFASRREKLIGEVEDNSQEINRLKAQEELVVVVKEKASVASQIVSSRVEFSRAFEKLSQLVPQGVYFTDIRVSAGKIVISGKARTSADVAGLASSLVSATGSEVVSDVSIDSLSSDDEGVYVFVVSAKLAGVQSPKASASTQTTTSEEGP